MTHQHPSGRAGPTIRLADPTDPRIADYIDIRHPGRLRETGLFVTEGRRVVRRLLAHSFFRVRSILVSDAAYTDLAEDLRLRGQGAPVYVGDVSLLRKIVGFDIHRGCLAIGERPDDGDAAGIIRAARRLVVLEDIADADNVGGIFRNASAFGADGVLLSPHCCDPLYRKAIRTSMGASLSVPFARLTDWPSELGALCGAGCTVVALTPGPGAVDIAELDPTSFDRVAILLGSEGAGLSAASTSCADCRVVIPMVPNHDSLNVATASGIAMHRLFGERW